jgi:hypothetical protein
MFTKIINTEVLTKTGLFYFGDDASDHNGYPTKVLGFQAKARYASLTTHLMFLYHNCN